MMENGPHEEEKAADKVQPDFIIKREQIVNLLPFFVIGWDPKIKSKDKTRRLRPPTAPYSFAGPKE